MLFSLPTGWARPRPERPKRRNRSSGIRAMIKEELPFRNAASEHLVFERNPQIIQNLQAKTPMLRVGRHLHAWLPFFFGEHQYLAGSLLRGLRVSNKSDKGLGNAGPHGI